ncbi:MAG TPA: arginyltransferase [Candidatus Hydrogenedentes bacterium]|nr:arginyltransferase [Candidatus Hydrogenedentota bacterium]
MDKRLSILEAWMHLADVPEPCPYLPDRVATLRFVDGFAAAPMYRLLLDRGYRRSGCYAYRPVCQGCDECQSLRVPVETFRMSKEQRRIWNRGRRIFEASIAAPSFSEEKLDIYRRYLQFQHNDHERKVDEPRYREFLVDSCLGGRTMEIQFRVGERLACVGIADRLDDALSTVYCFFDPNFARWSPGTYSALYEIDLARRWGLRYYYMGFYIRDCDSMNYKIRYLPCELKRPDETQWRAVPPRAGNIRSQPESGERIGE